MRNTHLPLLHMEANNELAANDSRNWIPFVLNDAYIGGRAAGWGSRHHHLACMRARIISAMQSAHALSMT